MVKHANARNGFVCLVNPLNAHTHKHTHIRISVAHSEWLVKCYLLSLILFGQEMERLHTKRASRN